MEKFVVQEIEVPSTSLAMRSLSSIDFADAFKCHPSENQPQSIDSVTRAIFSTMPRWIEELLELRNTIVRPLGLRTSVDLNSIDNNQGELKPGGMVGVFGVIERKEDEILLGEDDNPLNYRVSIQLEHEGEKYWIIVSTVVQFNNWLGRAYFVPVKPVHKIIIPAMMRSGLKRLENDRPREAA